MIKVVAKLKKMNRQKKIAIGVAVLVVIGGICAVLCYSKEEPVQRNEPTQVQAYQDLTNPTPEEADTNDEDAALFGEWEFKGEDGYREYFTFGPQHAFEYTLMKGDEIEQNYGGAYQKEGNRLHIDAYGDTLEEEYKVDGDKLELGERLCKRVGDAQ